jgi:TP901 family phage tail tape measure protein
MPEDKVLLKIEVTGGEEFSKLLDQIAQPLNTINKRVDKTAAAFRELGASMPTGNTVTQAAAAFSALFKAINQLPSESVLIRRAKGLEKIALSMQTVSVFSRETDNITRAAKAIEALAKSATLLKPASVKNLTALFTTLEGMTGGEKAAKTLVSVANALQDMGTKIDPSVAANVNKMSVGFKNFVKTLGGDEFAKIDVANFRKFGSISLAIKETMETLGKVKRPKTIAMVADSLVTVARGFKVLGPILNALPSDDQLRDLNRAAGGIARALAQFNKIKPINLQFTGSSLKGLVKAVEVVSTLSIWGGKIPIFSLRRLVRVGQFLAKALRGFAKIPGENLQHVHSAVKALLSVLTRLKDFSFEGKMIPLFSLRRLVRVGRMLARAMKGFNKVKGAGSIASAASAVRALAKLLPVMGELGTDLAKPRWKFWAKTVAKDIGRFFKELIKSLGNVPVLRKIMGRFDKNQIEQVAAVLRALAQIMQSAVVQAGQVKTVDFSGLEDLFVSLRKGLKHLKGIKISKEVAQVLTVLPKIDDILKKLDQLEGKSKSLFSRLGAGGLFGRITEIFGKGGKLSGVGRALDAVIKPFKALGKLVGSAFKKAFNQLRPDKFISNMKRMGQAARRFGNEVGRAMVEAGRTMSSLSRTMLQTGQALLRSPFSLQNVMKSTAVSTVADFESITKQIEVLGGVSADMMPQVSDFLLQLGADSVFSASQAADAFLELAKSGLSVEDSFTALPEIMNLAAAGGIEIADAASIVIASVGAFGMTFDDTKDIVDSFAAAANVSTAEVADLSTAFGYAAPQAAALGLSVDDLNAMIALLQDRGIQASRAGTALRATFSSMAAPTEKAAGAMVTINKALKENAKAAGLNLSIYDDAGNLRSIDEFANALGFVADNAEELGFSAADVNEFFDAIGGSANAVTAMRVLGETTEDGQIAWMAYREAMGESASAADIGAALMDTFKGSIEALEGSIETLMIKSLLPLMQKALRPMVDFLTKVVNGISSLPQPILSVGAALAGVVSLFVTLVGTLSVLGAVILGPLAVHFTAVAGALLAILNPLHAIGMLVAAGGGLAFMLVTALALAPVIAIIAGGLHSILQIFSDPDFGIDPKTGERFGVIKTAIATIKEELGAIMKSVGNIAGIVWKVLFGGKEGDPAEQKERLAIAQRILDAVSGIFTKVAAGVGHVREFVQVISAVFSMFARGDETVRSFSAKLQLLYNLVKDNPIFEALLGEDFTRAEFATFVTDLFNKVVALRAQFTAVGAAVATFFENLLAGETLAASVTTLMKDLGEAVDWNAIVKTLTTGLETALGAATTAVVWTLNTVTAKLGIVDWTSVTTALTTGLETAIDAIATVIDWSITNVLKIRADLYNDWFLPNRETIESSITGAIEAIWNSVGAVSIKLLDKLGLKFDVEKAKADWATLGTDVSSAIGSVITDSLGTILGEDDEAITTKFANVKNAITGFFTDINTAIAPFADVLAGQLSTLWVSIKEAFAALGEIDFEGLLKSDAANLLKDVAVALGVVAAIIADVALSSINAWVSMIPPLVDFINALISGDFSGAAKAIRDMFSAFIGGFVDMIAEFLKIDEVIDGLINILEDLPDFLVKDEWIEDLKAFREEQERSTDATKKSTEEQKRGVLLWSETTEEMAAAAEAAKRTDFRAGILGLTSGDVELADALLNSLTGIAEESDQVTFLGGEIQADQFTRMLGDIATLAESDPTKAFPADRAQEFGTALLLLNEQLAAGTLQFDQYFTPEHLAILEDAQNQLAGMGMEQTLQSQEQAMLLAGVAIRDYAGSFLEAVGLASSAQEAMVMPDEVSDSVTATMDEATAAVKELVEDSDLMSTAMGTDWEAIATTLSVNAPIIVTQIGTIETAFADLLVKFTEFNNAVQLNVPLLREVLAQASQAMASGIENVKKKLAALNLQLINTTVSAQEQLPLLQASMVNAFTLMDHAVFALLGHLTSIPGAVGDAATAVADISMSAPPPGAGAAFDNPEGRAKGGPVMAGELYEVAEGGIGELLELGGRSYLIPGANGRVIPPGESPGGVSAAGPGAVQAGGGQLTDPAYATVEVLRHNEAMTANIEITLTNMYDLMLRWWDAWQLNGNAIIDTINALGTALAGGGGGGGGGGGTTKAGTSGGGLGGARAPAPTEKKGFFTDKKISGFQQAFADKFHAGAQKFEKSGKFSFDFMEGDFALGGAAKPFAAHRVAEGGRPELFQSGGRTYLLTGQQGGKITPLNKFMMSGPGGGMGGGGGGGVNIQEGDINITITGGGASDQALVQKVKNAVIDAQSRNRQKVGTTLRKAGRI